MRRTRDTVGLMSSVGSPEPSEDLPAEGPPTGVPRWPATVALVIVGILLAIASTQLDISELAVPLVVIAILIVPLTLASIRGRHDIRRNLGMAALVILTAAVFLSAVFLVRQLINGVIEAPSLLAGSAAIWAANLGTFALWYWEIDGGGPSERRRDGHISTDFLFPQMQIGDGKAQRLVAGLPRLPVRRVQRELGLQPDRHVDPVAPRQGPDDAPVADLAGDRRGHRRAGDQHAQVMVRPSRRGAGRPAVRPRRPRWWRSRR